RQTRSLHVRFETLGRCRTGGPASGGAYDVVALLFSLALAAEPTGPVVGVVVDSDGRGVPNASVRLEIGGRASGDGKTDAAGRFAFAFDLPGDVRLTVTAPGFAPAVVAVEDRAARTPPITLELTRLFEEVQVTPAVDLASPAFDGSPLAFAAPPLRTRAAMTLDDALK